MAIALGRLIGATVAPPEDDPFAESENEGTSVTITPLLTQGQAEIALDIEF
jgi:hypothetical protein